MRVRAPLPLLSLWWAQTAKCILPGAGDSEQGPPARVRVHAWPMLDRWAIGAIVLLGLVCLFSTYVALDVWLPDPRERARIRAERVERMLREESEDRLEAATMAEA